MSRKHVEVKGNILVVLLMLDLLIKCGGYSTVPFLRHFVVHGLEARRPFTSMMRAEGMADGATSRRRNSELVGYKNTQKAVPIDRKMVVESTSLLLDILGVPDFKVDVWLCSESKIKQLNDDWRGVNESTDILSFPANDFIAAEVFDPTDPTLAFEKHLGDIVVAPNYVKRACDNDQMLHEQGELNREEDKGCYKEMSHIFTVEDRLPMLLIHGLLHLLGHDHESEEEWLHMTSREIEVLQKFRAARRSDTK